jgi:hypothetical protein
MPIKGDAAIPGSSHGSTTDRPLPCRNRRFARIRRIVQRFRTRHGILVQIAQIGAQFLDLPLDPVDHLAYLPAVRRRSRLHAHDTPRLDDDASDRRHLTRRHRRGSGPPPAGYQAQCRRHD